jgi:predicted aspartyl protease
MKKIAPTLVSVAIGCAVLAGCGTISISSPGVDNVPASIELPNGDASSAFLLHGGFIVVDVLVNGAGPYAFLVDTGASVSVVSPKVAAAFNGDIVGVTSIVSTADANRIQAELVLIDRFQLGPVSFEQFQAAILPSLSIAVGGHTLIAEGILGAPLFQNVLLTVDYPGRTVRIRRTGSPESADCTVLPVNAGPDGLPSVALDVAGREVVALIDTGNNEFLVVPAAAGELPFVGPTHPGIAITVTGTVNTVRGVLDGVVQSGCVSFDNPVVTVGGELATLGARAFLDYTITLDQPSARLWFQSSTP